MLAKSSTDPQTNSHEPFLSLQKSTHGGSLSFVLSSKREQHLSRLSLLVLWHAIHTDLLPTPSSGKQKVTLLHSSLVQVLRNNPPRPIKGIKNPEGLLAHRDCARELTFRFGAALPARCCPFPVSSTVTVVNAPLSQRIGHYTTPRAPRQPHRKKDESAAATSAASQQASAN